MTSAGDWGELIDEAEAERCETYRQKMHEIKND